MRKIERFLHCKACWENKPGHVAMKDYARLSVGLTQGGTMQVWCERHDLEVADIQVQNVPLLACVG